MKLRQAWTLLDRVFPRRRMRRAWNLRARTGAAYFVACGHSESDARFWASGKQDLDTCVLRDLVLESSTQALEIGCGLGRLLRPLASRVERAWGVDISDEMVTQARDALADVSNVEVLRTDGWLNGFADATLDLVYSFIVFQHIPAKRVVSVYIREAARVLKGDGVFRFQVDGHPRPISSPTDTWLGVWFAADALCRELEANGFGVVDVWGEGTHYLWVTAIRRREPGRGVSTAVGVRRRSWSREELERLLSRLGGSGGHRADAVVRGDLCLRQLAQEIVERHRSCPAEEFVRSAYRTILDREADAGGLAFYSKEIANGVARENTVDCLLASAELEDRLKPHVSAASNGR